jgi:hypothetical protein
MPEATSVTAWSQQLRACDGDLQLQERRNAVSIALMNAAWKLELPASSKLVLLALCDWANDDGDSCHPSIKAVAMRASLSARQAQRVMHILIDGGWMSVVGNVEGGAPGETRRYLLNVSAIYTGDASDTGDTHVTGDKLSRVTPATQTGDTHVVRRVTPATQTGDTHVTLTTIYPPLNLKSNHQARAVEVPDWIPAAAWTDWNDHRRSIRKPLTPKAAELSIRSLAKLRDAGHDPRKVIDLAIERGWTGLFAPRDGPPAMNGSKPPIAQNFSEKTYTGTPDDELPDFLRVVTA